MEMDPDFALGMLKTISTFLDFFATKKILKNSFKLYNFWIFKISHQNQIRLRGYVGAWLAFRPEGVSSTMFFTSKVKNSFYLKIIINIRKKKFGSGEIWTRVPWTKGQSCSHITRSQ